MISLILLLNLAKAQMRESLFKKPETPTLQTQHNTSSAEAPKSLVRKSKPKHTETPTGNLPAEYSVGSLSAPPESPVILPGKAQGLVMRELPAGSLVRAEILESVIAFSEAKAPIRAVVTSGRQKGLVLIGEAVLERNSKRILISFNKLTLKNENYQTLAHAMDMKGILGLKGELISGEGKYFTAELLSAGAAGMADASIDRSQNALGNYVEEPSVANLGKKALTAALSKSTERFADKLKSAPEYSVLEGPIEIQILITEQPKQID